MRDLRRPNLLVIITSLGEWERRFERGAGASASCSYLIRFYPRCEGLHGILKDNRPMFRRLRGFENRWTWGTLPGFDLGRPSGVCVIAVLSPHWGSRISHLAPRPYGVGCILAPLRGYQLRLYSTFFLVEKL